MRKTGRLCPLLVAVVAVVAATAAPSLASGGATITRQSVVGSTLTCDGEVFNVTAGAFQIATHETLTPSGAYHVIVEGNAQGVKAVAPSGTTYRVPGGFWIEVNVTPGATVMTETDASRQPEPAFREHPGLSVYVRDHRSARHPSRAPGSPQTSGPPGP